jgi:tetratricopeptide (TPR) repeat protein
LVDLKRTREALKELEAALVAGRDGQWRHIAIPAEELLARLQIEEKDFAGAANHYQHLLSVDSRNYEANYNLAWLAARENRLPDGVRYLEAAVKARPKDAAARNALGGLYLRLGRLDEAAGELLKAAELDPKSHWAPFNLGLVYRQKRDLDAAAAQFRRALELQPGFEGAARMLREMGR